MFSVKRVFFVLLIALVAGSALASNFRAGDTVYLPSAGKVPSGAVTFVTDVYITNLTSNTVTVNVGMGLTGGSDNRAAVVQQTKSIGTNLAPGERRLITDITGTLFPENNGRLGYLVFYACRAGGNCSNCDANPADCSLISVEGRIYSFPTDNPNGGTKGQLFAGYPWYSFVSQNDAAQNLDKVFFVGLRNEGSRPVSGYRSNFGILNSSQDYSTVIRVSVFSGTGQLIGSKDYNLAPLGHIQTNILDAASGFTTNNSTGWAEVQQISATFVQPLPGTTGCQECDPGFFTFGSVLDNVTDDPTTLESQYKAELDLCVYGSKSGLRPVRRAQ